MLDGAGTDSVLFFGIPGEWCPHSGASLAGAIKLPAAGFSSVIGGGAKSPVLRSIAPSPGEDTRMAIPGFVPKHWAGLLASCVPPQFSQVAGSSNRSHGVAWVASILDVDGINSRCRVVLVLKESVVAAAWE